MKGDGMKRRSYAAGIRVAVALLALLAALVASIRQVLRKEEENLRK